MSLIYKKGGVIRAICFDLDNTLWEIEPVLVRAERILADWLGRRYPRIGERFTPSGVLEMRAALLADLDTWLLPWMQDVNRLQQLAGRLGEALLSRLDHRQRQLLDEYAPTHLTVPTGSRIAVDYLDDNAPCLEVRMQEVFGLADTPRIGGGRVPVTLKLLSPARRPMQITRDLAGFWRGSYAEVRKDMRGRYPRHYWPENPLAAEPVRGVRPRRG